MSMSLHDAACRYMEEHATFSIELSREGTKGQALGTSPLVITHHPRSSGTIADTTVAASRAVLVVQDPVLLQVMSWEEMVP
jgi:hypothetical protein